MFNHTEWQRKRRSENPERYREEARKYFRRHKDDPKWREKHRASARQWYSLHKEKRNANAHDWHQYLRAAAIEHYGKVCACCGESTYEFLCIDHINGGGNRQRKQYVHFQFVNPVGIIERQAPASQRHGLERNRHLLCFYNNSRSDVPPCGNLACGCPGRRFPDDECLFRRAVKFGAPLVTGGCPGSAWCPTEHCHHELLEQPLR